MSLAPFQVYYAQEVRPYALCVLLSAGLLWVFASALMDSRSTTWGLYVFLGTVALYTHYFFGFVLVAFLTWALIGLRDRVKWRALLVSDFLVGVAFLPQAGTSLERTRTVTSGFWVARPSFLSVLKTFDFLLFASTTPRWLVPVALFGTLGLLAVSAKDLARTERRGRIDGAPIHLSAMVISVPIVAVFAISYVGSSIYVDRSFALVTPALLLILAASLAYRPKRTPSPWLAGLLGIVAAVSLAHFYLRPDPAKPRFREAGAYLTSRAAPDDMLLHVHDSTYFSLRYYAPDVEARILENDQPWLLPEAWPRFAAHVPPEWADGLPAGSHLWVAVPLQARGRPQKELLTHLEATWNRVARIEYPDLALYRFRRPGDSE
jgi:uncharacterized membrane protein